MNTTTKRANDIQVGDLVDIGDGTMLRVTQKEARVRIGEDASPGRHTLIFLQFGPHQASTVPRDFPLQVQSAITLTITAEEARVISKALNAYGVQAPRGSFADTTARRLRARIDAPTAEGRA